jgi:stage II sporulation protein D
VKLKINILNDYNCQRASFTSLNGSYIISSDKDKVISIEMGGTVQIIYSGTNKVQLLSNGASKGIFSKLYFDATDSAANFRLTLQSPLAKTAFYDDDLEVLASKELLFINNIELNRYVAGVLEGEIGNVKNNEFLKLQAVISRTYAMKHRHYRHAGENFELCDKVHCQVYHGKSRFNHSIRPAVDSTGYQVIADSDTDLIEAVFSANCGGMTCNSEEIWSKQRSYLRCVVDTFCTSQPQASWQKSMSKSAWLQYLSKKTKANITDPCISEIHTRQANLSCYPVSYKDIRNDLKLRSAFFNITSSGDQIILKGRGFGHGVGMCQEGSMRMAELGYCYSDVIHFYYTGVRLVDLTD